MPQKDKGFTDSFKETVSTIKDKAEQEGLMKPGADMVVLLVLLAGIIVSFFNIQWAAILIGVVVGYAFSDQLVAFFKGIKGTIHREGLKKILIIAGLLIFLIIALPGGVIAALIALLVKGMISNDR